MVLGLFCISSRFSKGDTINPFKRHAGDFGSENARLVTLCQGDRTDPCDFTFKSTSTGDSAPVITFNQDMDSWTTLFLESYTIKLSQSDFDEASATASIALPTELEGAALCNEKLQARQMLS